MNIIFSDDELPEIITKSIFLAGPSPRNNNTTDWRHEAISILESLGFNGTVFIPSPKTLFYNVLDKKDFDYNNQVEWEIQCRQIADIILFWIPRNKDLPGFTTNIEIGEDFLSGKAIYGRPDEAEKCKYLDKKFSLAETPFYNSLDSLLKQSILNLGEGSIRKNGEIYVPLFIWNTPQFKSWYSSLKNVGNRLDKAKVLNHKKFKNGNVFLFSLWVKVWIESEQRYKENEFIISRKDISTIVPYYKDENNKIHIILVREFRSSVNNNKGFIYELPGGSSTQDSINPLVNAQQELNEEIGLFIKDINRFQYIGERQLTSTILTHKAQNFSISLTKEEFETLSSYHKDKTPFGLITDSELTYVEIAELSELKNIPLDYSMLGIIFETFYL